MRKTLGTVLVLLIIALMLISTGCARREEAPVDTTEPADTPAPAPEPEEPAEPAVSGDVVFAVYSWGVETYQAIVDGFKEQYPDVNVEIVGFEGGLNEFLTMQAAAGTLPDVAFGWENITFPISQGWINPLDEFLSDDQDIEHVDPVIMNGYQFNGKTYAVPTHLQFSAVLVNLDLLDMLNLDPPTYDWTIDQFRDYMIRSTTDKYSGINHLWGFDDVMSGMMSDNLHQMAFDPEEGMFRFTDGSWVEAINFQKELKAVPGLVSDDLKNQALRDEGKLDDYQKKFGEDTDALREGLILTGLHGTWDWHWISTMPYRLDMYPLPSDPDVGYRQALHADHAFMMSTAKSPEAAFALLRWISYGTDGTLFRLDYKKNKTDADGNPTPAWFIPANNHPDVVAFFKGLDIVPEGVKYMFDNVDKSFRADYSKIVPGWDKAFWEVIFPKSEEIRAGQVEASAVAAELEQRANEILTQAREEFNKTLR